MPSSFNISDQFAEIVSRETIEKLIIYHKLLLKWQDTINLISPNTIQEAWQRHFIDSIQPYPLLPSNTESIVDLGSGAGFTGLVLAAIGPFHVTLIESDRRKCIFLREVARELGLSNVEVINKRIEDVGDIKANVITARALAPLSQLFNWAKLFIEPSCEAVLIFPKGQNFQNEIDETKLSNDITIDVFDSATEAQAKIVRLSGFFS